jgi:hypothetical protein
MAEAEAKVQEAAEVSGSLVQYRWQTASHC